MGKRKTKTARRTECGEEVKEEKVGERRGDKRTGEEIRGLERRVRKVREERKNSEKKTRGLVNYIPITGCSGITLAGKERKRVASIKHAEHVAHASSVWFEPWVTGPSLLAGVCMQLQLTILLVPGASTGEITSKTWYWPKRVLCSG